MEIELTKEEKKLILVSLDALGAVNKGIMPEIEKIKEDTIGELVTKIEQW